jgi:hypothetical protein
VIEMKEEISRIQGTAAAQQELYKLALRADGGAVREDDAEAQMLEIGAQLSNGDAVAMAVKECLVTIYVGEFQGDSGEKIHSFLAPSLYAWLCKAAQAGAISKDGCNSYLHETECDFYGLGELFEFEDEELAKAEAEQESYAPCSESEWPAWFMKHVYTEGASAATPETICVSTNNDEWPVIYALGTDEAAVIDLIHGALREVLGGEEDYRSYRAGMVQFC